MDIYLAFVSKNAVELKYIQYRLRFFLLIPE